MFEQSKLNEINKALQETADFVHESKICKSQKRNTQETLSSLKFQYDQLKDQLRKEEKDVEKLQSISLANLFHSIIKDKNEKLSKEELEVLEVKTKMNSLDYEIAAVEERIRALDKRLAVIGDVDSKYSDIFEQKKAYIEAEMPEKWSEIEKHTLLKFELLQKQKEVKEALNMSTVVMDCIRGIMHHLDSASGWGVYDMLGGGLIATFAKRDNMAQAEERINELRYQLTTFNKELGDIGTSLNVDLQLSGFLDFADWFFDGFFVDFMIQGKINETSEKISDLYNKVTLLNQQLKDEESGLYNVIDNQSKMIEDIIKRI